MTFTQYQQRMLIDGELLEAAAGTWPGREHGVEGFEEYLHSKAITYSV